MSLLSFVVKKLLKIIPGTNAASSAGEMRVDSAASNKLKYHNGTDEKIIVRADGVSDIEFDNTISGLSATDVKAALDEIDGNVDTVSADKVTGPGSATDNAIPRYDLTTGKIIQDSGVIVDDSDNMTGVNNLTVEGDLTVNGTTTTINTATLDVEDVNITINKNGVQATADDAAGLTVEMSDATDAVLIYDKDATSKWKAGETGSEVEIVTINQAQVITAKDIDGGTASNTSRVTIPSDTKTNLDGLTRKKSTILYASDEDTLYTDDGTTLTALATTGGSENLSTLVGNAGYDATVAASALTVALKIADGSTNPSSPSPVRIAFRDSTLTEGGYNIRAVTSALSMAVTSGATLGHSSGEDEFIYIYAIDNVGTVELALSTSPSFSDLKLYSTTAMSASADTSGTLYSTVARSGVPIRKIGRLISNQTTAGTWAAIPTEISSLTDQTINNQNKYAMLYDANTQASTNTTTWRYNSTSTGSGLNGELTINQSTTLGDSITANIAGEYECSALVCDTAGFIDYAIKVNTNNVAGASPHPIGATVIELTGESANRRKSMTRTIFLKPGDVVSLNADPSTTAALNTRLFLVVRKVN